MLNNFASNAARLAKQQKQFFKLLQRRSSLGLEEKVFNAAKLEDFFLPSKSYRLIQLSQCGLKRFILKVHIMNKSHSSLQSIMSSMAFGRKSEIFFLSFSLLSSLDVHMKATSFHGIKIAPQHTKRASPKLSDTKKCRQKRLFGIYCFARGEWRQKKNCVIIERNIITVVVVVVPA